MMGYMALTAKEFVGMIKTRKALILFSVFILFGILSPVIAKMMPDIINSLTASMAEDGFTFTATVPTAADAYFQLFKNFTQMGLIVLLLVFSNILSGELSKGTLITLLSKGLRRDAVILAKYTAALFWWTAALALSAATAYLYSLFLFGQHDAEHLFFSVFCLWLFVSFIIALILLSSVVIKGNVGGLVIAVGAIALMFIINISPNAARFNPIALASHNANMIIGKYDYMQLFPAMWVTIGLCAATILITLGIFRKKAI